MRIYRALLSHGYSASGIRYSVFSIRYPRFPEHVLVWSLSQNTGTTCNVRVLCSGPFLIFFALCLCPCFSPQVSVCYTTASDAGAHVRARRDRRSEDGIGQDSGVPPPDVEAHLGPADPGGGGRADRPYHGSGEGAGSADLQRGAEMDVRREFAFPVCFVLAVGWVVVGWVVGYFLGVIVGFDSGV